MKYYHFVRSEIEPLLPKDAARILDVGAGAGATLRWVKTFFPKAETTGVELNPEMLGELQENADVALIGDIDACLPKLKTYNLILLLDVLEHLKDSTGTLQKLSRLLEPEGRVIVSVPNLAHFSVSLPLLLKRRFDYQDAGILDRTHLRFFVEDTAIKLLNDANLIVRKGLILGLQGPKTRLLDGLSFGVLRHHLAKQYVMLGQLSDGEIAQQDLRWIVAR
jgi:2-polyprenyl-3-methyl-5-hydroxy-6-metoxy-1,4-benzoquinol methylase